ncbi:acyltransferase [Pseudobutyrivibrio ruminis]|uniref:acyltransferase n=1 Tax=Pseudobutyrivibrio ruminis TaxID=46206 RepID=UPI00068FB0A3|nr:acyltransferase [Pseudobutyrivibrio ruminis]
MSFIKNILKSIRYIWLYVIRYHKFERVGKHTVMFKPLLVLNGKHVSIGDYSYILKGMRLECVERYNEQSFSPKVTIGNGVEIGQGVQISCASSVEIGNNVGIGPYCMINDVTHGHEPTGVPYLKQDITTKPISIGEGTMLGYGVMVLPGVHIGKYCMIGAYSIIAKDIPDYTVVTNHSDLRMRSMKE